jgi:hypothetical protein
MMNEASRHKLAEHEVIFREANKNVADFLTETEGKATKTQLPFFCECSNKKCKNRIKLTPQIYKSLIKNKRQFIVLAGHEIPEIEKVVRKKEGFNVIEKFGDPPTIKEIKSALKNTVLS